MTCKCVRPWVFFVLTLVSWASAQSTFYWNRNAVLSSSTDFSKAYNWNANADGTGARPATAEDDDFTANGLGSAWTCQDSDNNSGTGTCDATTNADQLSLIGQGGNVWGNTNQFTALRRSDITGSFDVSVKVVSISNTSAGAKAGIMIADDLTSLSSGGYLIFAIRQNGVVVWERDSVATVGELELSTPTAAQSFPIWLRVVKNSLAFSAYYRTSLANAWTQVGTSPATPINGAANSQVALFHTANTGSTGTAVLDDFQAGTAMSATNNILSFNGTGAGADANATLSASQAAYSIDFTGYTGTFDFGSYTLSVNTGNATFVAGQTITPGTGVLAFTAASGTQVLIPKSGASHPAITHTGAGTLQLSTNALSCLSFSQSAGILDFNALDITTTSSGNFTVTNGATTSFKGLGGRTLTVAGAASFTGQSGDLLNMNAATWTLAATGAVTASYASIAGSNASVSLGVASNCTNGGGNTNWSFPQSYSSWPYSMKINFNTTSTGANVSGDVTKFPLLVRLDSNNFFFNQAKSDGADIRFADPDGSVLPYEIERWDATNKKGEVWVKVPQVDGNSLTDYITLYWGNASATAITDSKAVFDTADSYQAVWHLDEGTSGTGTANLYQDATYADNDGDDNISATGSTGVIGLGQQFDGVDDYIATGSSVTKFNDGDMSLSFWVKLAGNGGGILNKGDGDGTWEAGEKEYYLGDGTTGVPSNGVYPQLVGYNNGYVFSSSPVPLNDWHHLVMTWDWDGGTGGTETWYLDGAATSLSNSNYDASPADPGGSTVRIGMINASQATTYFTGYMDEMEISSTARSADFVKLSYETQRAKVTALVYSNTALSTFAYSTKLYVNTTASGANVSSTVTNFPMLVRLTQANFNFSQAKSDGGDLRFADSTGALLSYEIDRFDATNKLAEIWVLLPTVTGNNNTQWFKMYWGKGTATSLSSGGTVYASTNNYVGVYHLQESSGTTTADATNNAQTGTFTGTVPNQITGNIGKAHSFDGNGDYVTVPTNTVFNMSTSDRVTISAWVNRQGANVNSTSKEGIAGRYEWSSGNYREFSLFHYNASTGFSLSVSTAGSSATETILSSNYQATTSTWYHVVGVADGTYLRIYVNGVERAKTAFSGNIYYSANAPFNIGIMDDDAGSNREYFNGYIDQVQVSNSARSADVIKLNYETQKTGSTVVKVGSRTPDYAKSTRLNFNTTSSGANVSGNVTNIPILVKFTSSTIDFSQTTAAGTDLLFVDPDGTNLYHEVVEWDPKNQVGKVWVRVPQVNGNDTTDYITVYYGCSTCTSNSQAVKDSVWSGYTSVFHLNAPEAVANDAATLANHGAYQQNQANISGLTTPNATVFNGTTDFVDVPNESNYDFTTNVTVAAWVKVTSFPSSGSAIATKGNTAWRLNRNATSNFPEFVCTSSSVAYSAIATTSINDAAWHYVVGTYNGTTVTVYVDGAASGTTAALAGSLDNIASHMYIGENAGSTGKYWNGPISEVRVSNNSAVQSANFIKLSYENQRSSNTLFSTPITTASFTSSKVFKFNTTASGVNVAGDVYNFPLLLRITGTTICDAVRTGATDIRFLDADGVTWLDYQVERWSQSLDSAEVWVKVPKIDGNSASDFITMYYNDVTNDAVPDGQCATCTFDGSLHKAVWHMDDNTSTSTVVDSRNAYNGTLKRSTVARTTDNNDAEGYIGPSSLSFVGTATPEYVDIGSNSDIAQSTEALTISAWVKASALGTVKRDIVFLRTNATVARSQFFVSANSFLGAKGRAFDSESGTQDTCTTGALSTGTWYNLAMVMDYKADSIFIFINGTRYATARGGTRFGSRITSATTGLSNGIGGNPDGSTESWQGLIDEVRISPVALDSNWIKLSYQTQRKDSTLLFNPSTADFTSSKKYMFNTTKTGANLTDSVTNFPLLVRIAGSTICDAVQGSDPTAPPDIRFLDSDGKTWLQYQVERWSRSLDSAEVWVLVPQVDANSDHDFVTLYYNDVTNGAIADAQCASCVFSPSNGFAGVWHINEDGNTTANGYVDATGNGYHGTGTAMTNATDVSAQIGLGQTLNGSTQYVSFGTTAGSASTQTVSYWMKSTALANQNMFDKNPNDASGVGWTFKTRSNGDLWYRIGSESAASDVAKASAYAAGTWTYVTGTFDGSATGKLYINGALATTNSSVTRATNNSTTTLRLGKPSAAFTAEIFAGTVDELQISSSVRDSNWIKLSYQNQKLTSNVFWNARPGPNNNAVLTASAGTNSIALSWPSAVSDSTNADSVGLWVKYTAFPDSVGVTSATFVKKLVKTDTTYSYPAYYPGTYYFALAVRNSSGYWSPYTKASSDTAVLEGNAGLNDTIYVDSAIGNNSNSCAQARNPATPRLTLNSADGCDIYANDTLVIRVMPGTYTGANNWTFDSDYHHVRVESFDNNSRAVFNSASGTITYSSTTYYPTIYLWGGVSIKNLDIMAGVNAGVGVMTAYTGSNNYNIIEGCRIFNNGNTKHTIGIFMPLASNDYIHVANNLIIQPNTYGISTDKDGGFNIENNTLIGPGTTNSKGIYMSVAAGAADMTISNNVLKSWDYGIQTTSANIGVCANNLFWLVTTGQEVSGTSDAAKILKDPLFASTTLGESSAYKLLPGSPAIDAGTTTTAALGTSFIRSSPVDLFGNTRPVGSAPDIGLYEGTGFTNNPTGDFDSLTIATTSTTITINNSKWKVVFDQARGGGINAFYDMSAPSTNLLASNSLLLDVTIDSYVASSQTSNTIAPSVVWKTRTACQVRQRLAVSASLDLYVYYNVQSSGHIYVQTELVNLTTSSASVGTLTFNTKVGTATSVYANGGTKNGFGYLTTATRDVLFATTRDLDTAAIAAETWAQTSATGASGYVQFSTSGLDDPAGKFRRNAQFLLYIGDTSLTFAKAAAINADANSPSALTLYNGSDLHVHSWQSQLMGHWSFDEGGGSTLRDNSVYQTNHGTLTSMTYVSAKRGAGGSFTNASEVSVADNATLEASLNFTLTLWIKPTWASIAGTVPYVIWKGTSSTDGYNLQKVSGQNQLTFRMGSGTVTVTVPTTTWTHLAFVVEAGQIHAYANGVLMASSTTNATATANASALIFGDATGSDKFYGTLDDIRIYANAIPSEEVQAIVRQGFARKDGLFHLRADNNNRVVATLNPDAAATRFQPAFLIDNWFAGRTPKYVYLNGVRLKPNVDYVSDSVAIPFTGFGARLCLQVNKTILTQSATLFIDDDDSTGYLGASSLMPKLTLSATASDKIAIKNFADTTFGSITSKQWYMELDLNGWTTWNSLVVVDSGFGEINIWKAAAIDPGLAISSSTNQVGIEHESGRSLVGMKFDATGSGIFSGGAGYAGPANITYTVTDSSSVRFSITLAAMSMQSSDGTFTLTKRWTFYPTGQVFGSYVVSSLGFNLDNPTLDFDCRYNSTPTALFNTTYSDTYARGGWMGGDPAFHSFIGGILSIKNATSNYTGNATTSSADLSSYYGNTSGKDYRRMRLRSNNSQYTAANTSITTNFFVDISRDFNDSATADSLANDVQTPAAITGITGTAVTNDALDFNADGFAEGDGAYVYQADANGIAQFSFNATVPHFNPAFRITNWTLGTLPDYVLIDNQSQVAGYTYNAFVDVAHSTLVLQFNKTFSGGAKVIYISHKSGLAVTLRQLSATGGPGVDSISWVTESEVNNLGYHIWRRTKGYRPGSEITVSSLRGDLESAKLKDGELWVDRAARMATDIRGSTGAAGDTVPEIITNAGELTYQGWQRITYKIIPGAPSGRSSSTRQYTFVDENPELGAVYDYLLEAVDVQSQSTFYGTVAAGPEDALVTGLQGAYPNPFNPITTLRFSLATPQKVSLIIYNAAGRVVRTLVRPDRPLKPGRYRLYWDAKSDQGQWVASGPYFYQFKIPKYVATKKMIYMK